MHIIYLPIERITSAPAMLEHGRSFTKRDEVSHLRSAARTFGLPLRLLYQVGAVSAKRAITGQGHYFVFAVCYGSRSFQKAGCHGEIMTAYRLW